MYNEYPIFNQNHIISPITMNDRQKKILIQRTHPIIVFRIPIPILQTYNHKNPQRYFFNTMNYQN